MAVPKYFEFFNPFLRVLSDRDIHTSKEVRTSINDEMQLSDEELSLMIPSGRITCFYSRVNWAKTYLDRAGLIDTPSRGKYQLTDEGKKVLKLGDKVDLKYLERYESFLEFQKNKKTENAAVEEHEIEEGKTPIEALDDAFEKVNDSLSSQLMDEVMKLSPVFFMIFINLGLMKSRAQCAQDAQSYREFLLLMYSNTMDLMLSAVSLANSFSLGSIVLSKKMDIISDTISGSDL